MNPKPQLKLTSRLIPALVGLLLILQLLTPYRGWLILLVGLGGAWLISFIWARSLARHMDLAREMRFGWVQVGDHLIERFYLTNESRFPALWVEVLDHSSLPDYRGSRGTGVPYHGVVRWHREATCRRRGLFTLGPTSLRTGDPFGLYTVAYDYPASLPLLVLPPIVPLPAIEVAPGGRTGEGRPRPFAYEQAVSASAVREYVPGDSLRWIHWKTTARRGKPFVRLFDSTPTGDWWIVLDMHRYVQVGLDDDATDEHGIILAASLADRGLGLHRPVGLAAHGKSLVWLPPREGPAQRWEVLRSLALLSRGERPLETLLARMEGAFSYHASLIIITSDVNANWLRGLEALLRRGAVPTVLLLDPQAFGKTTADATAILQALEALDVVHYRITPDLLDRPEIRAPSEPVWRTFGTGKAVRIRPQAETGWRALG